MSSQLKEPNLVNPYFFHAIISKIELLDCSAGVEKDNQSLQFSLEDSYHHSLTMQQTNYIIL